MRFDLSMTQEQIQTLSAAQIQSLQLLAMDNFELRQMMQAEYLENPLLEYERHPAAASVRKGYVEDQEKRRELPAREHALKNLIIGQLQIKKYSKKQWSLIKFLVGSLDDNGFLAAEPEELAALIDVDVDTVLQILEDLKKVEPRGLFARDMRECLLLQLQPDCDPLVRLLVQDHLERIARVEVTSLARELSVTPARIRKAIKEISLLNPRPLNGLDTNNTHYVIPDILLEQDPVTGRLEAALNDDWSADYRLSDYYVSMIRASQEPELQEYFKKKYQRAKLLIEGIEQRRTTLLAIGNFLGRVQRAFLLGKGQKVTVTMTDAAAELEMSVSTVSRAVKGKYIQHPAGCTALKDLFVTPVSKETSDAPSRDAIKDALQQMIDGENKQNPYSDAQLVEQLQKQGIGISRRTVAKYREALGIPGCFDRKHY